MDVDAIAARVSYVGSPDHKDAPSFAGRQSPRKDASICDRELSKDLQPVTKWLKTAIQRGAVGGILEGDVVYEARLVNRELGKGYPLNKTEWPEGLDLIYG
jgi:hypothetical protein